MLVTAVICTHPGGELDNEEPLRTTEEIRTSPAAVPAGFAITSDVVAVALTVVEEASKTMP